MATFTIEDSNKIQDEFLNLINDLSSIVSEKFSIAQRQKDDKQRTKEEQMKGQAEEASKFVGLATFQKIDLNQKALLQAILNEGLKIIGLKNITFNIHLFRANSVVVAIEGGANAEKRKKNEGYEDITKGLIGKVYNKKLPFFYLITHKLPPILRTYWA